MSYVAPKTPPVKSHCSNAMVLNLGPAFFCVFYKINVLALSPFYFSLSLSFILTTQLSYVLEFRYFCLILVPLPLCSDAEPGQPLGSWWQQQGQSHRGPVPFLFLLFLLHPSSRHQGPMHDPGAARQWQRPPAASGQEQDDSDCREAAQVVRW